MDVGQLRLKNQLWLRRDQHRWAARSHWWAGHLNWNTAGLNGSWREVETWYHAARSKYLNRGQERLLAKVQPSCNGDPTFWRCQYHWMTKDNYSCGVAPTGSSQAVHAVASSSELRRWWVAGAWPWTFHCWTLVLPWCDCVCVVALPFWSKKVFTFSLKWESRVMRPGYFREILYF